jgi:hypothetical protein
MPDDDSGERKKEGPIAARIQQQILMSQHTYAPATLNRPTCNTLQITSHLSYNETKEAMKGNHTSQH